MSHGIRGSVGTLFIALPLLIANERIYAGNADTNASQTQYPENSQSICEPICDESGSLSYFWDRLSALERNELNDPVRVLFYSTSNNGYDRVGSRIRKVLQERFGDGGKGFVPIVKHWLHLRHRDIEWATRGFKSHVVTKNKLGSGNYGIGGILAISSQTSDYAFYKTVQSGRTFVPGTQFSNLTLFYQQHETGGNVQILIDNKIEAFIDTSGPLTDTRRQIFVEDGSHEVLLKTRSNYAKLYGIAFEREKGIVFDSAMLVGARITHLTNFNSQHISEQIALRSPDLIMFQFGENDAVRSLNEAQLEKISREYILAINNIRRGKPEASCMVVSTKDIGSKRSKNHETIPGVLKILKISKQVARETNCAFYDLFNQLGGSGTMNRWRKMKRPLVSKDYGHLLNRGAFKVGSIMAQTILDEYDSYRRSSLSSTNNSQWSAP
jgi:lysophospholipase L1-like esterase